MVPSRPPSRRPVLAACSKPNATPPPVPMTSAAPVAEAPSTPPPGVATGTGQSVPADGPKVGGLAPDFTLPDLDGKPVALKAFRGRVVVLEWFNPSCPFVNASHTKATLKDLARRHAREGVVWLAVNSAGPGRQGYEVADNRNAASKFGLDHPILRDEKGVVGRAYGATNTPSIYVVDGTGVLAYAGAVDNSPDGEGGSPTDGKLVNYVDAALADVAARRPVATPKTKPWGCTVKYGS